MSTHFTTSLDSTRIAFDISGEGTPLLLLHGGGGSRADWHTVGYVARFKEEFSLILMDLRGHGESDKPRDPARYSTEKMGQDILAVADACGADRFMLCGYSFGGNAGRYLAASSDRVAKMVMMGNRLGTGVSGEFRQFVFDFRDRWASVVEAAGDTFDPNSLSAQDQEEIQQLSFPGGLLPAELAFSTAMLDWGKVAPADLLCPALWLIGSENKNAMDSFRECQEDLPVSKVQVRIFEGMTHAQEFESIDQILPAILNFIKS
jgi:pimeloyl-ACP methyl ester carboxylesterase